MSLATRCAACGTVFRVVQDQLRVSSGWVRCGRCGEVFNAVESLVDLEMDRPGEGNLPSVHGARVMEDLARLARPTDGVEPDRRADVEVGSDVPASGEATLGDSSGESAADGIEVSGQLEEIQRAESAAPASHDGALETSTGSSEGVDLTESGSGPMAPRFVQQAERAARWRHPMVRLTLVAGTVLAAVALAWQVLQTHHDWVAARWPATATAVQRLCVLSDCLVGPPRYIEALVVESSGLLREGSSSTYRLTMVLRNREPMPVRMPSADIVMTDAEGRVVLRRALNPAALGVKADRLDPSAELPLVARLQLTESVVGYTIELFYP